MSIQEANNNKLAALRAEVDQAQATIDEARALPHQTPEFVMELDAKQMRLNLQKAQIKNLQNTINHLM